MLLLIKQTIIMLRKIFNTLSILHICIVIVAIIRNIFFEISELESMTYDVLIAGLCIILIAMFFI